MTRWKFVLVIVLIAIVSVTAVAQTAPRDYALTQPVVTYSNNNLTATITFDVSNNGGDAVEPAVVNVIQQATDNTLISQNLAPLGAGEVETIKFPLVLSGFDAGQQFFVIEVGIDSYEPRNTPFAEDNSAIALVNVPSGLPTAQPTSTTPTETAPDNTETNTDTGFVLPILDVPIRLADDGVYVDQDFYSRDQILMGIAGVAVGLVFLWFITLILRLLFSRKPTFGTWQPPYAYSGYHDPNSTIGRRQGWQTHAQSGTIFAPCTPNNVVAVKHLLDMDGKTLGEWQVKALRTVQYDMYGRITRTEVIMPSKIIKKLNKLVRRSHKVETEKLQKQVNSLAKDLTKRARKPINKKGAMLPLAMDLRFEGKHGEVRILFELYQCRGSGWYLIDQWEPEMGIIGHKIIESYTYTLNGQLPGESYKDFKSRLVSDMAWVINGMLYEYRAPTNEPIDDPVPPDTLTGMAPITDSNIQPIEEDTTTH